MRKGTSVDGGSMNRSTFVKRFALLGFLFLFLTAGTPALAGPDASPSDVMPQLNSITFDGEDIVFSGRYVLRGAVWSGWARATSENKNQSTQGTSQAGCKGNLTIPSRLQDQEWPPKILLCDGTTLWFSTPSYCSEGADRQGSLYALDTTTSDVVEHHQTVLKCESIIRMVKHKGYLYLASIRPAEYGPWGGEGVLVYDAALKKRVKVLIPPQSLSKYPLLTIAIDPDGENLWMTTRRGIARVNIRTDSWSHRFFDFGFGADNTLKTILSEQEPTGERLWIGYHVITYFIQDAEGFSRAWAAAKPKFYDPPAMNLTLLPFYLSGLEANHEQIDDFYVSQVLRQVGTYEEAGDVIRPALSRLMPLPLGPRGRSALVELGQKFGTESAGEQMDRQFEDLKEQFFSGRDRFLGQMNLCDFAYRNEKYLERLNTHLVSKSALLELDVQFFDYCIRARASWKGADAFLPTIRKALRTDDRKLLTYACSIFNHYAEERYRDPEMVVPLLRARRLARFYPSADYSPENLCRTASYWAANSSAGVEAILAQVNNQSELAAMARDVLREVTGRRYPSLSVYRRWWDLHRQEFEPTAQIYHWKAAD